MRISNMEKKGKEERRDYLCTVGGQRGVGRIEERRPVTQAVTSPPLIKNAYPQAWSIPFHSFVFIFSFN
jgi:hypothetical protein